MAKLLKSKDGTPDENLKRKRFAMYSFETISEFHLSQEQICSNASKFLGLFSEILKEDHLELKVASLRTIVIFL